MNDAAHQLRCFVERIERIDEQAQAIRDDRKDVLAEAKGHGFDTPTIRKIIQRRKMLPQDRDEADALLETYEIALGMARAPMIDGGDLSAELALPAPTPAIPDKASRVKAEALAWAGGSIG